MVYLWNRVTDEVLLIRRYARLDDDHLGKVNGLGGKVEFDEGVSESARRELREEANVELTSLKLRGTITWSNFGPKGEAWLGFVFVADGWDGDIPTHNAEGTLIWVPRQRLLDACSDDDEVATAADMPMWAGDSYFIPLVFDTDERPFHGTMPYEHNRPLSWTFERL